MQLVPVIVLAAVDEGAVTLALVQVEVGQDDLVHHLSHKHQKRRRASGRQQTNTGFPIAVCCWFRHAAGLKIKGYESR